MQAAATLVEVVLVEPIRQVQALPMRDEPHVLGIYVGG